MTGILALILFIIIITINVLQWENFKKKYPAFSKLPSPLCLPILKNTYLFMNKDVLNSLRKIVDIYGSPCVIYIPKRSYITSVPEELKIILNHPDCLDKGYVYKFLRFAFQRSLLVTFASQWKTNRKIISKGFKQNILNSFVDIFYEKSDRLTSILMKKKYNENDIYTVFEKYTLETFCEATLGIKSLLMDEDEPIFVRAVTLSQRIMVNRLKSLIKMNNFLFSFSRECRQFDVLKHESYNFLQNVIDQKMADVFDKKDNYDDSKKLAVLDILLGAKGKLDFEYIKEELALFAGAATDTTAYSMAYTCCLLAMHPEIQQKVRDEVLNMLGRNRPIGDQDLQHLKYTEMVINETLRLIPVIPLFTRVTTSDIDLGTNVIPKDTDIIIDILNLHRNKDIYPDPLKFDPDRFLPEQVQNRSQYSFLPFSGGPRNCIGWKYAIMVMKTTIAQIVRNFDLTTKYKSISELSFESNVVLSTTHPLDLHFTPLNANM